jgi:hypothetical protein
MSEKDVSNKFQEYIKVKMEIENDVFEDEEDDEDDLFDDSNNVYVKKSKYFKKDLIDFYEAHRFTMPFMVYRNVEWWPIMDEFAARSHFI